MQMRVGAQNTTVLRDWVLEYLLETTREAMGSGCYTRVYPSAVHGDDFEAHLALLRDSATGCERAHTVDSADHQYWDDRIAAHQLVHLLLRSGVDQPTGNDKAARYSGRRQTYRERCERMLQSVKAFSLRNSDRRSEFGQRKHIFEVVNDLQE